MAIATEWIFIAVFRRSIVLLVLFLSCCVFIFIRPLDDQQLPAERAVKLQHEAIYKNIHAYIPANIKIVMNVNTHDNLAIMFYNDDIRASFSCVDEEDFYRLAAKKTPIAAFENHGEYVLPDYLLNYPYLYIIHQRLD